MSQPNYPLWRKVEEIIGEGEICDKCSATLATYAELCNAPLNEPCPGFVKIEMAQSEAKGKDK